MLLSITQNFVLNTLFVLASHLLFEPKCLIAFTIKNRKFNISVTKTGSSKSFQTLSGGEKRKVRIACSLALQDLVASRASKNIELFIGDEIDDALDTAGLERLMGILEAKARERGTVMIISHKEMKSWFRETITVEVKEGRSYVV